MDDFKDRPYAVFVEQAVKMIFDLDPSAILVSMETKTGEIGTCVYGMDIGTRARMMGTLLTDQIIDVVREHKEQIEGDE